MTSKIVWTIIGLIIIGLLIWVFVGRRVPEVAGPEEGPGEEVVTPEEGAGEEVPETTPAPAAEKTPIETAFEKAKDVEITGAKAKAVDAVLRPVLESVFDVVVDDQIFSGVKMKEEFGPMLTYVFNRKVTETERDAILSGLEAVDVKTIDRTEKVITVQKGSDMWVITFYLNNEQKSGLEITF